MISKNMKKQIIRFKNILFIYLYSSLLLLWSAYAIDIISENISVQTSLWNGSSNSQITFSDVDYINAGNNSTIIWNYLSGSYYDTATGFFELYWDDSNLKNNVHITWSTTLCPSDYGYRLAWYAYSENFGLINFDTGSSNYVYYCFEDRKLHGYAYSELIWFQNFEWISFDVRTDSNIVSDPNANTNTGFTNDFTDIDAIDRFIPRDSDAPPIENIPVQPNRIGTEILEFEDTQESIFYIIK